MDVNARQIPIAAPSMGDEEWQALREPIESGWLTQGPKVAEFERAFARRHEVEHALATTPCTTALHLGLTALGVGPGDEVIVPAFTWVATANAVIYCGATPVFVDVEQETYNIDVGQVERALTERTRAVIPVHLFGLCAEMGPLSELIPEDVVVLEDAACAAGASYRGRPAGGLGHAAAFSFHPRKSITTGEGGMLTTDLPEVAAGANRLRNHGASVSEEARHSGDAPFLMPDFDELGFNYRMTDLQAAVGLVQLEKLDAFVEERDRWARWYTEQLGRVSWLRPPVVPEGSRHAWQAFVCLLEDDAPRSRLDVMRTLHGRGIATRAGTHAVTELGYYRRRFVPGEGTFPVARHLQERTLALPLHNRMDDDDYAYVADCLASL